MKPGACGADGRRVRHRPAVDDRLRHQLRRVLRQRSRRCQIGMLGEGPVELHGVGIDQQLGRIEAVAPRPDRRGRRRASP